MGEGFFAHRSEWDFYSRSLLLESLLRHLIRCKENLGIQIASIHNLAFYLALVKQARERIIDGTFTAWKNEMVVKLARRL